MILQIENEFGSFGNDKRYLHNLVLLARRYLGNDVILYAVSVLIIFTVEMCAVHI
jgi:beta-galactosidase